MTRYIFREGALEDYTIQSGRVIRPSRQRASLAALQWAAERAGQSYGVFTQGLAAEQEAQIQEEFEAWRAARDTDRPHVAIKDGGRGERFIIGDADL